MTDLEKSETNVQPLESAESVPPYTAFLPQRVNFITLQVLLAGFLGPLAGNIYIPILPQLQREFGVSETCINGTVSVFMAIFAVAPLAWASYADFGGRKSLYEVSLLIFIVSNILLAAVPANIGALYVLRIMQAVGVSSVTSVGAGTIADVTPPKSRAKSMSLFMLGPQMGPILGPILSIISANGQWRWIFGFLAILGTVVYFLILFFLPETLRYLVGNGECNSQGYLVRPHFRQKKMVQDEKRPPKPSVKVLVKALSYPPVLLCTVTGALLFATFYGVSVTFAKILQEQYAFSVLYSSLAYMCPGISLICGSLIAGRVLDALHRRMVAKDTYIPEKRLLLQLVGIIVSMGGILGYGWTVDANVHVAAVFVFTFLSGFGMTWVLISNTTYLSECSVGQPATYVAIGNMMRNIAAAISAAIIYKLTEKMGFGWCFTGMALVCDLMGIVFTGVFLHWGPKWRERRESEGSGKK